MRRNLSPKIQPIRPNSINHQADCCTAQHDKAQFQIIIAAFHHKPDHKTGTHAYHRKYGITNHSQNGIQSSTGQCMITFGSFTTSSKKPKPRQKYKTDTKSRQRIFMCFDPMKHTAHDSFPFQLLSQTTVISLCSL